VSQFAPHNIFGFLHWASLELWLIPLCALRNNIHRLRARTIDEFLWIWWRIFNYHKRQKTYLDQLIEDWFFQIRGAHIFPKYMSHLEIEGTRIVIRGTFHADLGVRKNLVSIVTWGKVFVHPCSKWLLADNSVVDLYHRGLYSSLVLCNNYRVPIPDSFKIKYSLNMFQIPTVYWQCFSLLQFALLSAIF
jgi:hypothetical protein